MLHINNSIVKKAWGHEYLLYHNDNVAIWSLSINYGHRTSLHAHPLKNTGLIVLDGIARVSFLNNAITLKGIDKVMIFRGRFHQTTALSRHGVQVLEVETPEDKADLVRLQDDYGREHLGYETTFAPIPAGCLTIPGDIIDAEYHMFNSVLKIYQPINKNALLNKDFETVIIFLAGGIIVPERNVFLSQTGDVVSAHNLDVILDRFDIAPNTLVMEIRHD